MLEIWVISESITEVTVAIYTPSSEPAILATWPVKSRPKPLSGKEKSWNLPDNARFASAVLISTGEGRQERQ